MSPDLEAVLALQAEDAIVAQLNEKLRALDGQMKTLDAERKHVEESRARARATAEQEEKKRRELSIKVEDHKAMQGRNLATLDVVRKPKEATAAMAQVDMLQKVLSEEERPTCIRFPFASTMCTTRSTANRRFSASSTHGSWSSAKPTQRSAR